MSNKEILFSITEKDFRIDSFKSGGKGGQHQNTRDSGVRITHLSSGAVAESRSKRSQIQNKKLAFNRLVESDKFKAWLEIRAAEVMGRAKTPKEIEKEVEDWMKDKHLNIEYGMKK